MRKKNPVDRPLLPSSRAFVVQLHAEADVVHRRLHGRVEHVVSSEAKSFMSVEELVTFMVELLAKVEQGESDAD